MTKTPTYTKKGPGRRHVTGEPSYASLERTLYGSKLARKAFRRQVAVKHP